MQFAEIHVGHALVREEIPILATIGGGGMLQGPSVIIAIVCHQCQAFAQVDEVR